MDSETTGEFERRLNRSYFACGCDTAALFMGIALVGYAGLAVAGGTDASAMSPWLLGLVVLAVAAGLGKFVGKVRADGQFRKTVAELKRTWRAPIETSERISNCG